MKLDLRQIEIKIKDFLHFKCVAMAVDPLFSQLKNHFDLILFKDSLRLQGYLSFISVKEFSYFGRSFDINNSSIPLDLRYEDLEAWEKDFILALNHFAILYTINKELGKAEKIKESLSELIEKEKEMRFDPENIQISLN